MIVRKIAYNVLISSVGKVLSSILALVGIGLIARYLGKEGFGNYATALAFFSFFGAVADLGIYSIATREISRPQANEAEIIGKVFSLRILVSLIVFLLTPLFITFLPYSLEIKQAILISAAAFLFSSSYLVLNGVFQKKLAMDKVAISELIGKIVQIAVIFLAVWKDMGFIMIMFSVLFSMIVNFIFVFLWSRRYLKFKIIIDLAYWKYFLKESLPMGVSVVVAFMYFKIDTILLSIMKSSAEVGIYNAAYKVIENLSFFPGMVMGLILPIMSHRIVSDVEKFREISDKVFKFFVILVVPLVVGTLFLADSIARIIGGAGFAESGNVLRILIFALTFIFFGNIFNSILICGGLQKKLMYALSFCAVFNLSANILVIPKYSYFGAAAVSAATEFIVMAITFFLVAKYLSYKPKIEDLDKIFISGLVTAIFLYFFKSLNFFILLLSSGIVYFLVLWLTKGVATEEIKSIFKKV